MGRRWVVICVAAVLAAAAVVAIWALGGEHAPGDDDRVDAGALNDCLSDEKPVGGWKPRLIQSGAVSEVVATWSGGEGGVIQLVVLPHTSSADALVDVYGNENEFPTDSDANPNTLEAIANVAYSHSDQSEGPEIPDEVESAVDTCLEEAASAADEDDPSESFANCAIPPKGGGVVVELSARGVGCEEARSLVEQRDELVDDGASAGYGTASVFSCCTNDFHYLGDGQTEMVFHTGF